MSVCQQGKRRIEEVKLKPKAILDTSLTNYPLNPPVKYFLLKALPGYVYLYAELNS